MLPKDGTITFEQLKELQRELDKAIDGNGVSLHAFEVMFRRKPLSIARLNGALNMVEALLRYSKHMRSDLNKEICGECVGNKDGRFNDQVCSLCGFEYGSV